VRLLAGTRANVWIQEYLLDRIVPVEPMVYKNCAQPNLESSGANKSLALLFRTCDSPLYTLRASGSVSGGTAATTTDQAC
jgi:hypothetical protein